MRTKLAITVTVLVFVLSLAMSPAFSNAEKGANAVEYTIAVEGTNGVKLPMLLITKPSTKSGPTRESKVITVPFQESFKAQSYYVWFDTLEGGASGKDGDRIMGTYKINGEQQGGGFEGTIEKDGKQSFGFGNL